MAEEKPDAYIKIVAKELKLSLLSALRVDVSQPYF